MSSNAEIILESLDRKLTQSVELTLYGRAALQLGFPNAPAQFAQSLDVDAVLWTGQAEELLQSTNFWQTTAAVNEELGERGLYVSHLFVEDQVILTPEWRAQRVRLPGPWQRLQLYRLGNGDLLLSKLMRDDPQDQQDAHFLVEQAGFSAADVTALLARARLPLLEEVRDQFESASKRLLEWLTG